MYKIILCLNKDNTGVLLIGLKSAHKKVNVQYIEIGSERISPAQEAKKEFVAWLSLIKAAMCSECSSTSGDTAIQTFSHYPLCWQSFAGSGLNLM